MRISTLSLSAISLLCLSGLSLVQSWTTFPKTITRHTRQSSCPPLSAGFGASNDKKEGKAAAPLKPKQQWDRYLALKQAPRVMVGVQVQDTGDWLPVGAVKAKDASALEAAVLRQRALIAEVTPKTKLAWGIMVEAEGSAGNEGSWKALDPKAPTNTDILDKDIGFEGTPDTATGFYCVYDQGKVLNASSSTGSEQRPSAFKKKST